MLLRNPAHVRRSGHWFAEKGMSQRVNLGTSEPDVREPSRGHSGGRMIGLR
jgi:hypothetical protein